MLAKTPLMSTKTVLKRRITQIHGNKTKPFQEHTQLKRCLFPSVVSSSALKTVLGKNQ